MDKEKILEGMSYVDPALVEAADAAPCRRRAVWRRPALIAACLCLVLAGTAVAVAMGLNWTLGGPVTMQDGENYAGTVEVWSPEYLPVESLSQEARDLAADAADGMAESDSIQLIDTETGEPVTFYDNTYRMESWDKLERFLGVDVLPENPILQNSNSGVMYVGEESGRCFLTMRGNSNGLSGVGAIGIFDTACDPATDRSAITITIFANARTDPNPYNNGGGIGTPYRTEEELARSTQEEYTTPSGLPCLLTSTEHRWNGYFCHGAFVVDVKAQGGEGVSDQDVRAELIRILDAFQ